MSPTLHTLDKRITALELGSLALAELCVRTYRKTYKYLSKDEKEKFSALVREVKIRIPGAYAASDD